MSRLCYYLSIAAFIVLGPKTVAAVDCGVGVCSGGANDGESCAVDDDCADGGTCELSPAEVFFGLPHCPLGQVGLSQDENGDLVISNIGSSGEDGVAIDIGESDDLDFALLPAALPDGTMLTISKIGKFAGIPDQLLTTLTTTIVEGNYVLEPDFTPIGASTYTVQAFIQDVMVQEVSGLTGAAVSHSAASAIFGNLFKRRKSIPP